MPLSSLAMTQRRVSQARREQKLRTLTANTAGLHLRIRDEQLVEGRSRLSAASEPDRAQQTVGHRQLRDSKLHHQGREVIKEVCGGGQITDVHRQLGESKHAIRRLLSRPIEPVDPQGIPKGQAGFVIAKQLGQHGGEAALDRCGKCRFTAGVADLDGIFVQTCRLHQKAEVRQQVGVVGA